MGKIHINTIDDFDYLDELYGGTEKIKHGKYKKNNDEDDISQSQGLPAGWREGDSYIGRRKKARN